MQTEWQFPSSSSSAIYTTKRHADGALSCNCPAWKFKRGDGPRACKHTKQVEAQPIAKATPVQLAKVAPVPKVAPAPTIQTATPPAPMLASAMTVEVRGAEFDRVYAGWHMEEKHDGHRVQIVKSSGQVVAWSRPQHGSEPNVREIPDTIKSAMAHVADGIYDGELVVPGGNAWDVTAIGSRLVFVVFDMIEFAGNSLMGLGYELRREKLLYELWKLPKGQTAVTTVLSVPATWATVEAIWQRGGEGAILKQPGSKYRPGHRSPHWVKVKEKKAATLTITGFEEGKCGPYSKFMLRDDHGIETTVKVLTNSMLRDVEKNPDAYIGRRVVISYQLKTPSGKYRHGIFDHFAGVGE